MNVGVKSCSECPLCNNDMERGISCNYPGSSVEDYQMPSYNEEWIPANCPLIQNVILIEKSIGAAIKIEFKRIVLPLDIQVDPSLDLGVDPNKVLFALAFDKDGNKRK